jgi:hypothetical protein
MKTQERNVQCNFTRLALAATQLAFSEKGPGESIEYGIDLFFACGERSHVEGSFFLAEIAYIAEVTSVPRHDPSADSSDSKTNIKDEDCRISIARYLVCRLTSLYVQGHLSIWRSTRKGLLTCLQR